jgi:hypothetical protein
MAAVPKLLYLVRRPRGAKLQDFSRRILGELAPRLLAERPEALKLSLSEPGVPRPLHLPVKTEGVALVSLWVAGAAPEWTALVRSLGWPTAGYRVTESAPRRYDRHWPDGVRSPGATMLTLFRQRPGLSRAEFIRRWHEGHSPMALRIHPLESYVRNVVEERVTEQAAPFDGIVEEHFASARDLNDPRRFYGGAWRIVPNLAHILVQTNTFLHLPTIENHILHEHWLLSSSSTSA